MLTKTAWIDREALFGRRDAAMAMPLGAFSLQADLTTRSKPMTEMTLGATRALRATGAMFFAVFGGVWLESWAFQSVKSFAAEALIAALAVALTVAAYAVYKRHAVELAARPDTPKSRRAKRVFHVVNAMQWILIIVGANVLARDGLDAWIVPMIILVVGLHFLPLAFVFSNRPHYVTGAALVLLGLAYPLLSPAGPTDPIGLLGAGLILWASASWALRRG